MQPWIIEELWRREQQERQRREEKRRQQIQIDAPNSDVLDDESREDRPQRGVLIIEL